MKKGSKPRKKEEKPGLEPLGLWRKESFWE